MERSGRTKWRFGKAVRVVLKDSREWTRRMQEAKAAYDAWEATRCDPQRMHRKKGTVASAIARTPHGTH